MKTLPTKQHNPRVETICKALYEMALQLPVGSKLPTVRTLCTRFAASSVTMNEALSRLEARHVLVRRQGSGIFVSPKLHRKSIVVLLGPNFYLVKDISPFWGLLWMQFAQATQQRKSSHHEYYSFHLLTWPSEPGALSLPEELIAQIEAKRLHGIVSIGLDQPTLRWIKDQDIPLVSFASGNYGEDTFCVIVSSAEFYRLALLALVQQACRTIQFWLPALSTQEGEYLISYMKEQLLPSVHAHALPFDEHSLVYYQPALSHPYLHQEQGFLLAQQLLQQDRATWPDAIIISDDMMTDGALNALQKAGIQIGKDIKIATHANVGSPILFGRTEALTVIEVDPAQIVQALFQQLTPLLNGETPAHYISPVLPKLRQGPG